MVDIGTDVWVRTLSEDVWVPGRVTAVNSKEIDVDISIGDLGVPTGRTGKLTVQNVNERDSTDNANVKPRNNDWFRFNTEGRGGVDDLIQLTHLHEPAILDVIETRYNNNVIYTNTGPILLAVNPFQRLPLYTKQILEDYYSTGVLRSQGIDAKPLPPHVFAVADAAFRSMMGAGNPSGVSVKTNQSMLVSGESGAGKTETTKFLMQYLATVGRPRVGHALALQFPPESSDPHSRSLTSQADPLGQPGKPSVERRVLDSNPILEAFGNAKTLRNENSSRFGKFIQLQFNARGELIGARLETYLLEKVRLVNVGTGERGYHVFYQILSGLPEQRRRALGLTGPEDYRYTSSSGCTTLRDVSDAEEFAVLTNAMTTMGIAPTSQDGLFDTLAALLHVSNVTFVAPRSAGSPPSKGRGERGGASDPCLVATGSRQSLENTAALLGVPLEGLSSVLTSKELSAGGEKYRVFFSETQCHASVEALVKCVYSRLFAWVVNAINCNIRAPDGLVASFIGVLDIFGFESFAVNSFEQLCINYCNETLQQHFNQFIFKLEQEEYRLEEIDWSNVEFPDNQDCLDLVEAKKPVGILSLLDEQCLLPTGSDEGFVRRCYDALGKHPRFSASSRNKASNAFAIRHYAGEVLYSTTGFVEKNKDLLSPELMELLRVSSSEMVRTFFTPENWPSMDSSEPGGKTLAAAPAAAKPGRAPTPTGSTSTAKKGGLMSETVGAQFRSQLQSLLTVVRSTAPHYVRCLKPNPEQRPTLFNRAEVVMQLRCNGVLEAVRVARLGYPVRAPHDEILRSFRPLLPQALALSIAAKLKAANGGPESRAAAREMVDVLVNRIQEHSLLQKENAKRLLDSAPVNKIRVGGKLLVNTAAKEHASDAAASTSIPVEYSADSVQLGKTKVFFRRAAFDALEARKQITLRAFAITIQTAYRAHRCRKHWSRMRAAVHLLHRLGRGFLGRLRFRRIKERKFATVLQKYVRRFLAVRRYRLTRRRITLLQALQRGRSTRRQVRALREGLAAARIQAVVRARGPRRAYLALTARRRAAAVKLQALARGRRARLAFQEAKAAAKRSGEALALSAKLAALAGEQDRLERERAERERLRELALAASKDAVGDATSSSTVNRGGLVVDVESQHLLPASISLSLSDDQGRLLQAANVWRTAACVLLGGPQHWDRVHSGMAVSTVQRVMGPDFSLAAVAAAASSAPQSIASAVLSILGQTASDSTKLDSSVESPSLEGPADALAPAIAQAVPPFDTSRCDQANAVDMQALQARLNDALAHIERLNALLSQRLGRQVVPSLPSSRPSTPPRHGSAPLSSAHSFGGFAVEIMTPGRRKEAEALQLRLVRSQEALAAAEQARHAAEERAALLQVDLRDVRESALSASLKARREQEAIRDASRREIEALKQAMQAEAAELRTVAAAREKALQHLENELKDLRKKSSQLASQLAEREDEVAALKDKGSMDSDVKMALAQRLDSAIVDRSELSQLNARLRAQLDNAEAARASQAKQIQQLTKTLADQIADGKKRDLIGSGAAGTLSSTPSFIGGSLLNRNPSILGSLVSKGSFIVSGKGSSVNTSNLQSTSVNAPIVESSTPTVSIDVPEDLTSSSDLPLSSSSPAVVQPPVPPLQGIPNSAAASTPAAFATSNHGTTSSPKLVTVALPSPSSSPLSTPIPLSPQTSNSTSSSNSSTAPVTIPTNPSYLRHSSSLSVGTGTTNLKSPVMQSPTGNNAFLPGLQASSSSPVSRTLSSSLLSPPSSQTVTSPLSHSSIIGSTSRSSISSPAAAAHNARVNALLGHSHSPALSGSGSASPAHSPSLSALPLSASLASTRSFISMNRSMAGLGSPSVPASSGISGSNAGTVYGATYSFDPTLLGSADAPSPSLSSSGLAPGFMLPKSLSSAPLTPAASTERTYAGSPATYTSDGVPIVSLSSILGASLSPYPAPPQATKAAPAPQPIPAELLAKVSPTK